MSETGQICPAADSRRLRRHCRRGFAIAARCSRTDRTALRPRPAPAAARPRGRAAAATPSISIAARPTSCSSGSTWSRGLRDGARSRQRRRISCAARERLGATRRAVARRPAGGRCDEDRLPFADARFDLVVSVGVLDTVNDLPGALILIRRALQARRPVPRRLRRRRQPAAAAPGDARGRGSRRPAGRAAHPSADRRARRRRSADPRRLRACRSPTARASTSAISSLPRLVADLRGDGRDQPPRRARRGGRSAGRPRRRDRRFRRSDADGKTAERFEIVHLSGWAPAPDQPQPARARQRHRLARRRAQAARLRADQDQSRAA